MAGDNVTRAPPPVVPPTSSAPLVRNYSAFAKPQEQRTTQALSRRPQPSAESVSDPTALVRLLRDATQALSDATQAARSFPPLFGRILSGLTFPAGVAMLIRHGLGKPYQGYQVWRLRGGGSTVLYEPTWQPATVYAVRDEHNALPVGSIALPNTATGFVAVCITAGASGGTEPVWPRVAGATIADNAAVWMMRALDTKQGILLAAGSACVADVEVF